MKNLPIDDIQRMYLRFKEIRDHSGRDSLYEYYTSLMKFCLENGAREVIEDNV